MTVGKLKRLLARFPANTEVLMREPYDDGDCFPVEFAELWCIAEENETLKLVGDGMFIRLARECVADLPAEELS